MKTSNPRIVFFGTPELCIPILNKLKECNLTPIAVVTQPDKPVGRKQVITPSPVKIWAQQNNIPIIETNKPNQETVNELTKLNPDLFLTAAYGAILPETILNLPKYGSYNIHYSLLPELRGASPIQSAILNNLPYTGITIQKMTPELDAGPIAYQSPKIKIDDNEFSTTLLDKLTQATTKIICEVINKILANEISLKEQEGTPTYCYKIKKEQGKITHNDSDEDIWRKFRALQPWPSIYLETKTGKRIKINSAEYTNGKVIATQYTIAGKKPITTSTPIRNLFDL